LRWQLPTADTVKAADAKAVNISVAAGAHGVVVATGVDAHGAVATAVAAHGMAAIGMAATGTTGTAAIGTIGTAGTIGAAMISSSLVAWDFRGGGVRPIRMDIMEATHMAMVTGLATVMAMEVTHMITVMGLATAMEVTRMITVTGLATAMEVTHIVTITAMEMEAPNMAAPDMEMGTATGANPGLPSYSAGSLALVIITEPLTASLDGRHVKQFAPMSRTTAANPVLSTARNAGESDRKRHSAILSVSTRG
jgi:hypothetical protein